jgi:ribulose-phosphate 3-epimerase
MVSDQLSAARAWLQLGAKRIILHLEALTDPSVVYTLRAETMASIGIALNNDTPLTGLSPYLEVIDFVQCMGIAAIGSQGNRLTSGCCIELQHSKLSIRRLPISVDGSVNADSLPKLKAVGVNRFVIGSALWREEDVSEALTKFALL